MIPDKNGNPKWHTQCGMFVKGQQPKGWESQLPETPNNTTAQGKEEGKMYSELVCPRTAAAIKLENESQLLNIAVALAAGASTVPQPLSPIPLWRSLRLTYFAITGFAENAIAVTLLISNIKQGGPWLGGELSSTNGNACASWSCEKGYCAGPIEQATIVVTNNTGLPIAGNVTIKIMYAYEGDPGYLADFQGCACKMMDVPATATVVIPQLPLPPVP